MVEENSTAVQVRTPPPELQQKRCTKCNLIKCLSEFAEIKNKKKASKFGRASWCRICHNTNSYKSSKYRIYRRRCKLNRYRMIYLWLAKHPCIDCGETNPAILEFDHRDPSQKSFTIGQHLGATTPMHKIWVEIAKCDIRCVGCHRKKTITARNGPGYEVLVELGYLPRLRAFENHILPVIDYNMTCARGAKHPNSKLSKEQIIKIIALYHNEDFSTYTIAEQFGVSQTTISRIINGTSYKISR